MLTIPKIRLLMARFTAKAMGTPMAKPIPVSFIACQNQFHYVERFGAQSEANTDLWYAPGDASGENAIDSY